MIKIHDRSKWFGASDTAMIMGSWRTKTFAKWWAVKLGLLENNFTNTAMQTGTAYEHKILDHICVHWRDRQIKRYFLRLRVNLDGETSDMVSEVKTHGGEKFKVSKAYWQQCQVEMFAAKKQCRIVAYRLLPEDYINWFNPIDDTRVTYHPIDYDPVWIKEKYLPRLKHLAWCLRKGRWPRETDL